jgi:NAD(P)-dependent dehydrogenase (short-subunit alcohol dehydrogenase family)
MLPQFDIATARRRRRDLSHEAAVVRPIEAGLPVQKAWCAVHAIVSAAELRWAIIATAKPEVMKAMVAAIPMGRIGTVEECVGAYLFLASEALASFVTGQIIEVNGGQLTP